MHCRVEVVESHRGSFLSTDETIDKEDLGALASVEMEGAGVERLFRQK